ncbi:heat shock protein beta-1-like [Daphnia pulex]|uniref:heat shock protein beta-1-like n=1 Tax=Daphnia pulex TaxID=6669 RepID=UPI001EE06CDB|nr:heat shock protein beta-1-like [Daphnia pulex]
MALLPAFDMDTILEPWADPFSAGGFNIVPRSMRRSMRHMDRELGKLLSSVKEDDKSFQVMVDVSHFQPNEISVKTTDTDIIVNAKHEERKDQFGSVTREFRRRVTIPKGVNHESVTSTMSPEGILTIMAPKMMLKGSNERVIPITMAPSAGSSNVPTPNPGN